MGTSLIAVLLIGTLVGICIGVVLGLSVGLKLRRGVDAPSSSRLAEHANPNPLDRA